MEELFRDYSKSLEKEYEANTPQEAKFTHSSSLLVEEKINNLLLTKNDELKNRKVRDEVEKELLIKEREELLKFTEKYYRIKENYLKRVREKEIRSIKIMKPGANSQEIEQSMKQGVVFAATPQLHELYLERHSQILHLEESLRYLRQLFIDHKILIENQGDVIIEIEKDLIETNEHLEEANIQIVETIVQQKKISKKMKYIFGCCCVVLVILLIVILVPTLKFLN